MAGRDKDHREYDAIFWNSLMVILNMSIEEDRYYWRSWERQYIRGLEA